MLSRILWVGLAGLALIGGIIYQGGLADHISAVNDDGRKIEMSRETRQALASAIGDLAAAKTELALLRARDADAGEIRVVERRSEVAYRRVEQLRDRIRREKGSDEADRATETDQDVREHIRVSIRG